MPKTPKKKKTPKTKAQAAKKKATTIHIKIADTKITAHDIEKAIAEKLGTEPTNFFRDNRRIIIIVEQF
jgi:hypothetical protein